MKKWHHDYPLLWGMPIMTHWTMKMGALPSDDLCFAKNKFFEGTDRAG